MSQEQDLQQIHAQLATIPESTVYSSDIMGAITQVITATTFAEGLTLLQTQDNLEYLLFEKTEEEGREMLRFIHNMESLPALPVMDVDFI